MDYSNKEQAPSFGELGQALAKAGRAVLESGGLPTFTTELSEVEDQMIAHYPDSRATKYILARRNFEKMA